MANQNFDQWLKFNKKPQESLRDAIYRFSNLTGDPDNAKEYLIKEYRDEIEQDEYNKRITEGPKPTGLAEGEKPYAGAGSLLWQSFNKLGQDLSGAVATGVPGMEETATDVGQWLQETTFDDKPAATREQVIEEGGAYGWAMENLPESTPTFGEISQGLASSYFPSATSLIGAILGTKVLGPGAGTLAGGTLGAMAGSTIVVTGDVYHRVLEDQSIREALGYNPNIDYTELEPHQQAEMRDVASAVAGDMALQRTFTSGLLEMPGNLFLPWMRGWNIFKQIGVRYAGDVIGGTAAEVNDERLYAELVADNFADRGLPPEFVEELRQKIKDNGREWFETAWSAFVSEAVLGGGPATWETGAAYLLKKDHRVNTPETIQNELQEAITEEAGKEIEKEKDLLKLEKERESLRNLEISRKTKELTLQEKERRAQEKQEQFNLENQKINLLSQGYKEDQLELAVDEQTGRRYWREKIVVPESLYDIIEETEVFSDEEILAHRPSAELSNEIRALENKGFNRSADENTDLDRNIRELKRREEDPNFEEPLYRDPKDPRYKDNEEVQNYADWYDKPTPEQRARQEREREEKLIKEQEAQAQEEREAKAFEEEFGPLEDLDDLSDFDAAWEEEKLAVEETEETILKDPDGRTAQEVLDSYSAENLQYLADHITSPDTPPFSDEFVHELDTAAQRRIDELSQGEEKSYSRSTSREGALEILEESELEKLTEEQLEKLETEYETNLVPDEKGLSPRLGSAVAKTLQKFFSGLGYKIGIKTRAELFEVYRKQVRQRRGEPKTDKDGQIERLIALSKTARGEGYVRGIGDLTLIPENITGSYNLDGTMDTSEKGKTRRLVQVAFHEIFGHLGLRLKKGGTEGDALSSEYKKFIGDFRDSAAREINKWLGNWGSDYKNEKYPWERKIKGKPTIKATEEYIARLYAEYGISKVWPIEKLVAALKKRLNRIPGFRGVSENDLRNILSELQDEYIPGSRSIISGKKLRPKARAQVQPDTEEEALEGEEGAPDDKISESIRATVEEPAGVTRVENILKYKPEGKTLAEVKKLQKEVLSKNPEMKPIPDDQLHITLVNQKLMGPFAKKIGTATLDPPNFPFNLEEPQLAVEKKPDGRVKKSIYSRVSEQGAFKKYVDGILGKTSPDKKRIFHITLANPTGNPRDSVAYIKDEISESLRVDDPWMKPQEVAGVRVGVTPLELNHDYLENQSDKFKKQVFDNLIAYLEDSKWQEGDEYRGSTLPNIKVRRGAYNNLIGMPIIPTDKQMIDHARSNLAKWTYNEEGRTSLLGPQDRWDLEYRRKVLKKYGMTTISEDMIGKTIPIRPDRFWRMYQDGAVEGDTLGDEIGYLSAEINKSDPIEKQLEEVNKGEILDQYYIDARNRKMKILGLNYPTAYLSNRSRVRRSITMFPAIPERLVKALEMDVTSRAMVTMAQAVPELKEISESIGPGTNEKEWIKGVEIAGVKIGITPLDYDAVTFGKKPKEFKKKAIENLIAYLEKAKYKEGDTWGRGIIISGERYPFFKKDKVDRSKEPSARRYMPYMIGKSVLPSWKEIEAYAKKTGGEFVTDNQGKVEMFRGKFVQQYRLAGGRMAAAARARSRRAGGAREAARNAEVGEITDDVRLDRHYEVKQQLRQNLEAHLGRYEIDDTAVGQITNLLERGTLQVPKRVTDPLHEDISTRTLRLSAQFFSPEGKEGWDISESRATDYDRFVSFGGKRPLKGKAVYDPSVVPKRTAEDAEKYVDNTLREAIKKTSWPKHLVKDLIQYNKLEPEFAKGLNRALKAGLGDAEKKFASQILARGREGFLKGKKAQLNAEQIEELTKAPEGYEWRTGKEWQALKKMKPDDVTTQLARRQWVKKYEISESVSLPWFLNEGKAANALGNEWDAGVKMPDKKWVPKGQRGVFVGTLPWNFPDVRKYPHKLFEDEKLGVSEEDTGDVPGLWRLALVDQIKLYENVIKTVESLKWDKTNNKFTFEDIWEEKKYRDPTAEEIKSDKETNALLYKLGVPGVNPQRQRPLGKKKKDEVPAWDVEYIPLTDLLGKIGGQGQYHFYSEGWNGIKHGLKVMIGTNKHHLRSVKNRKESGTTEDVLIGVGKDKWNLPDYEGGPVGINNDRVSETLHDITRLIELNLGERGKPVINWLRGYPMDKVFSSGMMDVPDESGVSPNLLKVRDIENILGEIEKAGDPKKVGETPQLDRDDLISFSKVPGYTHLQGEPFKKTRIAYALRRTLKTKPGNLYSLFIENTKPITSEEHGVWLKANFEGKKAGFAPRPGWHTAEEPATKHLRREDGSIDPMRVWAEVEIPDDVDWQAEADKSKTKSIPDKIPEGGNYRFAAPRLKGAYWRIAGAMKIRRVLTHKEANEIAVRLGVEDKDALSFSYVGEHGLRQFINRNGMTPDAKDMKNQLQRQKKGAKGTWFKADVDDMWRLEVPNTNVYLERNPFDPDGESPIQWEYGVNEAAADFWPVIADNVKKRSVKRLSRSMVPQELPYVELKEFIDLGRLYDFYPELESAYLHFDKTMPYGTAGVIPYDNKGLSIVMGVLPPDRAILEELDPQKMGAHDKDFVTDIFMERYDDTHDKVPRRFIAAILHEVQHVIQRIEGFTGGGNLEMFRADELRIFEAIEKGAMVHWDAIKDSTKTKIQKRFVKNLLKENSKELAEQIVENARFKNPFKGNQWANKEGLGPFADSNGLDLYHAWGKQTRPTAAEAVSGGPVIYQDTRDRIVKFRKTIIDTLDRSLHQLYGEDSLTTKEYSSFARFIDNILLPFSLNAYDQAGMGSGMTDIYSSYIKTGDYHRLAGEVEARDVEQRYIDMFRNEGRFNLPYFFSDDVKYMGMAAREIKKRKPLLAGGTERNLSRDLAERSNDYFFHSTIVGVPGDAQNHVVPGKPWSAQDMISYSLNDPLRSFAERIDVTTRARMAQIGKLPKGSPERREAIRNLHMELILNPVPFGDPTKPLPYQDELIDSSMPYEEMSWSLRLPGHELSADQLFRFYAKDPKHWNKVRVAEGGYEKGAAAGRGEPVITGLGLKKRASLIRKKGESDEEYQARIKVIARADYAKLSQEAAEKLYRGEIWVNWQKIRDMFGLNKGGRGRDAVPYMGHIINFMKLQREKLMTGKMTARDVTKALVMTYASQGGDAVGTHTVHAFTGGVRRAKMGKPGKANEMPASLKTFAEYMNGAPWVEGEANIGQVELNGRLTEDLLAEYYNKAPLWSVDVPWNGDGPGGDTQYEAIADGIMAPRVVSWEEASKTPHYDSNNKQIEGRFQYVGGKPQFVKVNGKWVFRVDGVDYHGMDHYNRKVKHDAYAKTIREKRVPAELQKIKDIYKNNIEPLKAKLADEFAGEKPKYTKTGKLTKGTKDLIFSPKEVKKIKKDIRGKISSEVKKIKAIEKGIEVLEAKILEDKKNVESIGRKSLLQEMPLWYRDPGSETSPNEKTGAIWVPQEYATTGGKPRMEDAVAYYFSTDKGQALLDGIEKGDFDLAGWRELANVRMAYGDDRINDLLKPAQKLASGEFKKAGLQDIIEFTAQFNEIVKGHVEGKDAKWLQSEDADAVKLRFALAKDLGEHAKKLYGISHAKQAFFKHFLGLGDAVTVDAIELNTHIAGSPATELAFSPLTGEPVAGTWRVDVKWWANKLKDLKIANVLPDVSAKEDPRTFFEYFRDQIEQAFQDIKADVDQRDPSVFEDVPADYFYHVMHHWLWDVGKALTRSGAVLGQSTERFRPATYEAMWRDNNQKVLAYFPTDPFEATFMPPWIEEHGTVDMVAEVTPESIKTLEDMSESISLGPLQGSLMQRSITDRFATGFYEAKDQNSTIWPDKHNGKVGYWMRGGMGYPLLADNANGIPGKKTKKGLKKGRAAWAADAPGKVTVVRKLQALGANLVLTVIGGPDMHLPNKAYWSMWWRETEDMFRKNPKQKNAMIKSLDAIIKKAPNKGLHPLHVLLDFEKKDNPGLDSWELFKRVYPLLSFAKRKPAILYLSGQYQKGTGTEAQGNPILGYPNRLLWEDTTIFKTAPLHMPVGLIQLDAIGNQPSDMRAADIGVPEHEAYEFVMQGEVIASFIKAEGTYTMPEFKDIFADLEKLIDVRGQYTASGRPFDIEMAYNKSLGKMIKNRDQFAKVQLPFTVPGAELISMGQVMDAPATPLSFSLASEASNNEEFQSALQDAREEQALSYSIFSKPLDRDWELPGGRKLSNFVTHFMEPFGRLDEPQLLRHIRRSTRGTILRLDEISGKIYRALKNTKYQKAIYEYLTTKGGDLSTLQSLGVPVKEQMYAKEAKQAILQVGKDLAERNLLSQRALDKYEDSYLPIVYLQYLLDDNDRFAIQRGQSNKVSNMEYLKRRHDIDKGTKEFFKGEVKDPAFLASKAISQPGRDMALLDMFQQIVQTSRERGLNWVLQDSIVEFDLIKEIQKAMDGRSIKGPIAKELAGVIAERDAIQKEIESLIWAMKDERKVLRAEGKMTSKALRTMATERKYLKERLKYIKPRHMSGFALLSEADRLMKSIWPNIKEDIQYRGPTERAQDALVVQELADAMRKKAQTVLDKLVIPKDYAQMPDLARYGDLRGLVVQKEIYDDLVGAMRMTSPTNAAEAIIGDTGAAGKISRHFKWAKVAANFPAAWIRNFSSNMILMNLGGMNLAKVPYNLGRAAGEIVTTWLEGRKVEQAMLKGTKYTPKRTAYDEVKDMGLTGSTFAAVELGRVEKELESFLNRTKRKGSPFRAFSVVNEFLNIVKDWTSDKYGFIDALGKTMAYQNNLDRGMDKATAADEAEKWLFDYSLVKPSVKTLRQSMLGAPFITFTSKVFPLMLETIATRPWRLAPYIMLPYAMAALFKDTHDLDDEEYKALLMSLQEYLREKQHAGNIMPLPYLDKYGRAQFIDVAYLYPWGMFSQMISEGMSEDPYAIMQTLGLMGGPILTLANGIMTNKDSFTRRPVYNPLDDNTQKAADWMKYLWNLMTPPSFHTEYGAIARLVQTHNNEKNRYGEPMKTTAQGISQIFGFNVSPVDPHSTRKKNIIWMQSELMKTVGYASRTLRDMKKMGVPNNEIKEKNEYFKALVEDRKLKLREYKKASKFPRNKLRLKKAG